MADLNDVVTLYRKSGCPEFRGAFFSASLNFNENRELIESLFQENTGLGRFKDVEVDDIDIDDVNKLPKNGNNVVYTFSVNQGSAERFYARRVDFIIINTLKRGEIPKNYYIAEDNYCPIDDFKPDFILKIEKICKLIKNLAKLAHFNDIKLEGNESFYKLVFILNSESKSSTAVVEINIDESILDVDNLDTSIIDALAQSGAEKDIHYIEKLNTFRNTFIEYVNSSSRNFFQIIQGWEDLNNLYVNNLAIYMSAFSFHKSRKEVSEAELEYAEKISKVVSELTTKALAIPVSIAASIATFQLTSKSEAIIALIGLFLTSLITSLMCASQIKQLQRIAHAKNTLFDGIEKRLLSEQSEIKSRLSSAKTHLRDNEVFCLRVLEFSLIISWVPTIIGTLGLMQRYL